MEIDIKVLKEQLSHAHVRYEIVFRHCATIKNWCITVWIAILIGIFIKKAISEGSITLIVLVLPILLFWILESIYAAGMILLVSFESEIEKRIVEKNFSIENTSDIMLTSMFKAISFKQKLIAVLKAAFTLETILFFYLILLILSLISIHLFF